MKTPTLVAAMMLAFWSVAPAFAQVDESGMPLVTTNAEASVAKVHPGDRFLLAFRFEMAPQWHIYWENPGQTGSPTTIDVKAPKGFRVGDVAWARPELFPGDFVSYGYSNQVTLFVPVRAPKELESGTVQFTATLGWLVCKESCLLGDAEHTIAVQASSEASPSQPTLSGGMPVGGGAEESDETDEDAADDDDRRRGTRSPLRFDDEALEKLYRSTVRRLTERRGGRIEFDGSRAVVTGPAGGMESVTFFPNPTPGVTIAVQEAVVTDEDTFRVVLDVSYSAANAVGHDGPPVAQGVIALGVKRDDPSYHVRIPVEKE